MPWRTRHYLLLILVLVVFLVHRDRLLGLEGSPWWRELPADYEVFSGPHSPYPFIINEPNKCPEGEAQPFLVLLITCEARQAEERDTIRRTWGNESLLAPGRGFIIVRLFLLGAGEGELGRLRQRTLESESRRHHDILQQDFLDTYHNLTIKTLMGMQWVATHCPEASYVMKTDSDMFVNTDYLIRQLLRPELYPKENYFTGVIMSGLQPIRNKNSKWYMSPKEYPGERYPTFCSGTGYVVSGDLAARIYNASLSIRRLHLEDVHVGVCLAELGVEATPPPGDDLFNAWRVPYSRCKYGSLITTHGVRPGEVLRNWHHLQNSPCASTQSPRAILQRRSTPLQAKVRNSKFA